MKFSIKTLFAAISSTFFILCVGCGTHQILVTLVNRTGEQIRLVEIDYPSASFGEDSMTAGQVVHYEIQIRNSGPVTVQYTTPDYRHPQMTGPTLHENQDGKLEIVLLPNGKASFDGQGLKN